MLAYSPTDRNITSFGPARTFPGNRYANLEGPKACHVIARAEIHILFAQSKNHAPAKIVEQVKSSSSSWIKVQHAWYSDFAWQTGYGEFSVSPMHVETVRECIRNQPEHHKQEDFQTEDRRFCEKNGKPLDEPYVWD